MHLQQMFAATVCIFALASSCLSLLPATAADVEPTILQQLSPIGWHALGYSPDGRTLVAGDDSRGDLPKGGSTVKVWDLASKQTIRSLAGHKGPVTAVCYCPDGRTLASVASYDTKMKIWDSTSGSKDGTIRIWAAVRQK